MPARHADQLVDRDRAVLVFRHVDADHFLLVAEEELGHRLRQLGLAHTRRPEEQQHAIGTIESVLQRPLVEDQPPRDSVDRLTLPDDTAAEAGFHVAEPGRDFAEDHVFGDLRDLRNHVDDIGRRDLPATSDFGLDGGGVEPADHLVRQLQVAHVARRHLECGLDRLVLDPHRVVPFEPRAQVEQDVPRLLDRRLVDLHGPEAARERLVFLDELLVFAERGRADDADLAAREYRLEHVGGVGRRAERRTGANHRVDFVDEQDQVRPLLDLADDVLDPVFEHAAQHGAGDHRVHLEVDHLAIAQAHRNFLGLELDAAGEPFGDRGLADAGLSEQQDRVRPLAVAEHLQDLIHLVVAAEHRRHFVLPGELVEVGGEVLEKRRQLEALLQPLLAKLMIAHPGREPGHERVRLDAVSADDRHRDPLRLFEDRGEQVGGLDRVAAGAARVEQRQFEEELRRRRHPEVTSGDARQQAEMFLERLQDLVRVQLDVPHHLPEHVPFDLGEGQADVLVGQERMLAAAGLIQRAVDDALG